MKEGDDRERSSSFFQVVLAVVSAFFGVRRRSDHDSVRLKPLHVIVVGVVLAALFVFTLLMIVRAVTG
jgi:hypothetical protein